MVKLEFSGKNLRKFARNTGYNLPPENMFKTKERTPTASQIKALVQKSKKLKRRFV